MADVEMMSHLDWDLWYLVQEHGIPAAHAARGGDIRAIRRAVRRMQTEIAESMREAEERTEPAPPRPAPLAIYGVVGEYSRRNGGESGLAAVFAAARSMGQVKR